MILEFLAISLGLHVMLANLGIGLSAVIPFMKRKGEKEDDEYLVKTSKNLMRFYASAYALAGVFGTAFTVFLLSYYPAFIGLAGHLTFVPFGLSILLIALHFLSLTLYWYGWDKFKQETHFAIGLIMMISAILIPLGFRAVFGFLNVPIGLELQPKPHLNVLKALTNPTFLTLYPKSILASLSATFLVLASVFAYKYNNGDERAYELAERFAKLGLITLSLTVIFGLAYAETLNLYVNYKFSNAFGALLGIKAEHDLSWILAIKMILIAIQFAVIGIFLLRKNFRTLISAGFIALAGVFLGEMLNAFSQYPYLIAEVSAIPKEVGMALADVINLAKPNPLTTMESLYLLTLAFLIPLLISSVLLVYLVVKPEST